MTFQRELPNITMEELAFLVVPETKPESFLAERIHFPADITEGIGVKDHSGNVIIKTLPGQGAYLAFSRYLDIPIDLITRLGDEVFVSQVYNRLLAKSQGPVKVYFNETTITEVIPATTKRIERSSVVQVAAAVIPDATIIDYTIAPGKFYVDLVAADGRGSHLTGTPPLEGDYCSGGLRFEQDVHQVPTVEEFFYRLTCTNGMQGRTRGAKVAAKGSVEQFLEEFAHAADVKFRSVEETISAYYEARTVHVPNIEQALARQVREQKLGAGLLKYMIELVPEYFGHQSNGDPVQETNQFELANFISNVALDSSKVSPADRRRMEKTAGAVASDTTHRCPACMNRLN